MSLEKEVALTSSTCQYAPVSAQAGITVKDGDDVVEATKVHVTVKKQVPFSCFKVASLWCLYFLFCFVLCL